MMKRRKIVWVSGLIVGLSLFAGCNKLEAQIEEEPARQTQVVQTEAISTALENDKMAEKDQSSNVESVAQQVDATISDGAVFEESEGITMKAVVKDILEDCLLVSSREDSYPGAFYVYFDDAVDIEAIQGGDEVLITWDGSVQETSPGIIYARSIEWVA